METRSYTLTELADSERHYLPKDLRQIDGPAYRLTVEDEANTAYAAYSPADQRIGIWWGAETQWGDCLTGDDIEAAISDWLNDADAWAARN